MKLRHIFAGLLTVAIVSSGAAPAYADEGTGSVRGMINFPDGRPQFLQNWEWDVEFVQYYDDWVTGGTSPSEISVTKEPDGSFEATGFVPGEEYALKARAGFYLGNEYVQYPITYSGGVGSSAAADYFQVDAGGQHVENLDLGLGGEIQGTVRDAAGAPIPRVGVAVLTAGTGRIGASVFDYQVSTDQNGYYSVRVPLGSYKVGFSNGRTTAWQASIADIAPGQNGLHNQWYSGSPSYEASSLVNIRSKGDRAQTVSAILTPDTPTSGAFTGGTRYVALGDSYQSGEGANPRRPFQETDEGYYYPATDTESNKCHRSYTAYSERLRESGYGSEAYASWACSGAVIKDLSDDEVSTTKPPWDDPAKITFDGLPTSDEELTSALERVKQEQPDLVTIGIGGNDMQFTKVLEECVKATATLSSCATEKNPELMERLAELQETGAWTKLFDRIREAAPAAHVVVVGYAHFYKAEEVFDVCLDAGVRRSDQIWINWLIKKLNDALALEASKAGFQYVDIYDVSTGHELCEGPGEERYMHGLIPGSSGESPVYSESYHPTAYGHELVAQRILDALAAPGSTAPAGYDLDEGDTELIRYRVTPDSSSATFTVLAPKNGVALELISPSGVVYKPTSAGTPGGAARQATSSATYTDENGVQRFVVTAPESGTWKLSATALQKWDATNPLRVRNEASGPVNLPPTASFDVSTSANSPAGVSVDASGSTDPDGYISDYLWDFGDGTTATGRTADHVYAESGSYLISLVVTDPSGDKAFADHEQDITIPEASEPILYERQDGESGKSEIWLTTDPSDTETPIATSEEDVDFRDPTYSQSAGSLVYVSESEGAYELVQHNWSGAPYVLVSGTGPISDPVFSPTGDVLAFTMKDETGSSAIYTLTGDGSEPTEVSGDTEASEPAWSPDGSVIIFTQTAGEDTTQLATVNLTTQVVQTISPTGVQASAPTWSPQGGRIAFTRESSDAPSQIWTMTESGTDLMQITNSIDPAGNARWSASDRLVYEVMSSTTMTRDIWMTSLITNVTRPVVQSEAQERSPRWL